MRTTLTPYRLVQGYCREAVKIVRLQGRDHGVSLLHGRDAVETKHQMLNTHLRDKDNYLATITASGLTLNLMK